MSDPAVSECKPLHEENAPIAWRIDVSLLGQPSMVGMFVKVMLISAGIMGGLLAFMSIAVGNGKAVVPMLELTAISIGVISVILLFVIIVIFRNRMSMIYVLDEGGAKSAVADRRARVGANVALIAGALTGKPGLAGAGLLSNASSQQEIAWHAVRGVAYSPRWRTIKLANNWRWAMVLYCLPDNYEAVAALVRRAAAAQPPRAAKNPLPGLLLRTLIVILASLPLFALPTPVKVDAFVPLLALCFGLASVWFLPIFGWVVIGCVAFIVAQAALHGLQPYHSRVSDETFPLIGLMAGDDWIGVFIAGVGALALVWLSLALVRGRYASALACDISEMSLDQPASKAGLASSERDVAPPPAQVRARFCTHCGARLAADGRCAACDATRRDE